MGLRLKEKRLIDWDLATLVPLAAAVHFPGFLANIPGWNTPGRPEHFGFAEDREYLLQRLEAEMSEMPLMLRRVLDLLGTSSERQFFELSLIIKKVNFEYIRLRSSQHIAQQDHLAMMKQLEGFLDRNQEFRDAKEITAIVEQLQAGGDDVQ